jgi:hypothetical protein
MSAMKNESPMNDQTLRTTEPTTTLPPVPKDALRMEYRLVVTGAGETHVNIQGFTDLPMALSEYCMLNADQSFNTMFQILLEQPAKAAVRGLVNRWLSAFRKRQQPSSSWLGETPGLPADPQVNMATIPVVPPARRKAG